MMETKLKSGTTLIVALKWLSPLLKEWISNGVPEIGFLAPDLVLYLDMPPKKAAERGYGDERYECLEFQRKVVQCYQILREFSPKMVDACQRIEDVQKQPQEIVLDHVLACQKAIFVAERVADERCEPSPGSDGSLVGYEVRLNSAM